MSAVIDGFAAFGFLALVVVIYAATMAWVKLRAANARLDFLRGHAVEHGAAFAKHAGTRSAGEEAVPSTYTIPKGPHA